MRKTLTVLLSLTAAATAVAIAAALAVKAGAGPVVSDCVGPLPAGALDAYRTQAADGNCLQGYVWAPSEKPPRAVLVVVHGLGDHARRYGVLAQALNAQGVAVVAQDHRGHAGSGGARQRIDSLEQTTGDVGLAIKEAARRWPDAPLFLHGHSFGGLVVTHLAATAARPVAGVVVSSAALQRPAGVSDGKLAVVRTLSALAPSLGLDPLDPSKVVREAGAQAALAADPLISREKLPARTIAALLTGVDAVQATLGRVHQPLLVLHGAADTVTPPAGSRALHERAASAQKTLRLFDLARHDLLHEPEAGAVTEEIGAFVNRALR